MDIGCEAKFEFEKVLRPPFSHALRPLAHPERFTMPRIATITSFHLKNNHNGSLFSLLKAETIRTVVFGLQNHGCQNRAVPSFCLLKWNEFS